MKTSSCCIKIWCESFVEFYDRYTSWLIICQVDCLRQLCILGSDIAADNYVTQFAPRRGNQWWRFVTSLYLHHGILDYLLITFIQIRLCWGQENVMGWLRMTMVYHTAGVGGQLVGLMPYSVVIEVDFRFSKQLDSRLRVTRSEQKPVMFQNFLKKIS